MLKGAASGAIELGIVGKLKQAGQLGKLGASMLLFHLASVAYAIGNYGDYSVKGFTLFSN